MSDPKPDLPPKGGLNAIEAALGSLAPARGTIDRDRLMFLAGRASVRRSPAERFAWPSIAAAFAVVALGEVAMLVHRSEAEPRIVERGVVLEASPTEEPRIERQSIPEPPAEVVILHRSSRKESAEFDRPLPGPSDTSPAAVRMRVLRLGIEGLPEPAPLPVAMQAGGESTMPTARSSRAELNRLLEWGEPS
ncbi:hypothetical protein [Tautonia rosea]|uniref:hypothetical protein n=1 Tax=Tautonia rosea TaxID=2728037 RepID=UPI0014736AB3|nr:hypothetical protein [Tautonia rosea]